MLLGQAQRAGCSQAACKDPGPRQKLTAPGYPQRHLFVRRGAPHRQWQQEPVIQERSFSTRQSVACRAQGNDSGSRPGTTQVAVADQHQQLQQQGEAAVSSDAQSWWDTIPARYKLIFATSLSFVICNMDKVNMSVAIIPMAQDYGWSPSVAGTIQAAFFYGYALTQIPSGYLASTVGGRKVLPAGVGLWSIMTCAVPLVASSLPGLCMARAGVGLGEAVAPSAATDMIARTVPASERSRAVSFVFGGLHLGSILGLLAAPALIHKYGYQSVFFTFGVAGLVWVAWFEALLADICKKHPEFGVLLGGEDASANGTDGRTSGAALLTMRQGVGQVMLAGARAQGAAATLPAPQQQQQQQGAGHEGGGDHHGAVIDARTPIPYRAFLRSRPVQALCFTHFAQNWFHFTMLSWLPSYFVSTLNVDLLHAAQTALFPPMAAIGASAIVGPLADYMLGRGLSLPLVRKLVQGTSFLLPTAFLLLASSEMLEDQSTATVACITAALGISSFSLAGLYCTHQDMSPRYASALLGLTNTMGALPGILGVATVGILYDYTGSWQESLFLPSAFFMVAGAYAYIVHGRNSPIDFDAMDNSPFGFEKYLPKRPAWLRLPSWGKQKVE